MIYRSAEDRRIAAREAHIAAEAASAVPSDPSADRMPGQLERVRLAIDAVRQVLRALESSVDGEVDASDSRAALVTAAGNLIAHSAVLDEMRRAR